MKTSLKAEDSLQHKVKRERIAADFKQKEALLNVIKSLRRNARCDTVLRASR